MNIFITILRIAVSLICVFSLDAMAVDEDVPTALELVNAEPAASSADAHPIGAWIEKNANWFGLFRNNPGRSDVENDAKKEFAPPAQALQTSDAAAQISVVMKDLEFGPACAKFASPRGFGAWGQFVTNELIRGKGEKMLEGTDDLRDACPAYSYMGAREKSYVWVKIFAAMSFLESSCDPKATAQGRNGRAAGILQLHEGAESGAAPGCFTNDAKAPLRTLRCGVAILESQIRRTGKLFSEDTHFGVLRPQGDLIKTKRGRKRVILARTIVGGLHELPFCRRD